MVWEGWRRETSPYPDLWRKAAIWAYEVSLVHKHNIAFDERRRGAARRKRQASASLTCLGGKRPALSMAREMRSRLQQFVLVFFNDRSAFATEREPIMIEMPPMIAATAAAGFACATCIRIIGLE